MVKKVFSLLNREFSGITEAAFLLGFLTLLAQILGLFRDRALAGVLGPSQNLDIYYAAFRVRDFLYVSICSLASVTVLIPFFVEKLEGAGGKEKAKKFFNDVFTVFFAVICFLSVLLVIFMPYLAPYLAPGFSGPALAKLISVSRIMLLSPIFLGISNMLGTVTQLYQRFFVYALSPVFYNVGILLGIFFFLPRFGVWGLALGVVVGALFHLAVQIPTIISQGFLPKWSFHINFVDVRRVVLISLPRTLTLSLNSLTILILVALGSKMREGSISIFNFAFNLQGVPLGIIGASYAVAAFPTLVKTYAEKNSKRFIATLSTAAQQTTFLSLPIITIAIVLRAQIVRLVLGSGQFTWTDTRLTAAALAIFIISIWAESIMLLLVRAYYAVGNTKTPLIINIVATVATIIFAYLFLWFFHAVPRAFQFLEDILRIHAVPGADILILVLAYSLGTILNLFIFWYAFVRDFKHISLGPFARTFAKTTTASVIMGFAIYFTLMFYGPLLPLSTFWGVLAQTIVAGIVGVSVCIAVLRLLKSEELEAIRAALHRKFWTAKIIAPEQKDL